MKNVHFIEAASACLANGERLIEDARWLPEDRLATIFALATIAQEEFAKAFLLFLVSRNALAWNSLMFRVTRDHASKQLLAHVMNYLNPMWEDFEARLKEWNAHHELWEKLIAEFRNAVGKAEKQRIWNQIEELNQSHRDIPVSVADAINILRYEKVGRWESSNWCWDEEPVYNPVAKGMADGKLDVEKQDALYVRLGPNGGLSKTQNEVKADDAAMALELARRLGDLVEGLLSGNNVNSIAYERIESSFKALFGGQAPTD
ncbi:MAG: AbiV family abortive infection protein [Terracidiphilus sp.]|jgi:AbiV family abortive infection protein